MNPQKLEKLLQQEQQLKSRIQSAKAKLNTLERKQRTGRLIAWGVVIEQMLNDPEDNLSNEQWAMQCKRFLTGRTLDRALTSPLVEFQPRKPESSATADTQV